MGSSSNWQIWAVYNSWSLTVESADIWTESTVHQDFEELEEASECATLRISSNGGIWSIKFLHRPYTTACLATLPPCHLASRKRCCHRGAAARARRRKRAADHQDTANWRKEPVWPIFGEKLPFWGRIYNWTNVIDEHMFKHIQLWFWFLVNLIGSVIPIWIAHL